jgi:uncharacterized membrane protein
VWAWGGNTYGQVGDGTVSTRTTPVQVGTDNTWVSISAGYIHSVGRKADGTLWVWGGNHQGELGLGDFDPRPVPTLLNSETDWRAAVGKNDTSHAIKTSGRLWGWGDSFFGQLGDGSTTRKLSPVQIGSDTDWVTLERAFYHSLALKANGTLWAWGRNEYGQVGDGTTVDKLVPTHITLPALTNLSITPSEGLVSSGNQGGPFTPSTKDYTLRNNSANPIDWTASKTKSWVGLSETSGTLAPGETAVVTVSIGSGATSLTAGSHSDSVTFTNETDGSGNTVRSVNLSIVAPKADVIVPTLLGPTAPVAPGQVIELSETTKNQGTGTTGVDTITRVYWSTNTILDASDPPVGERIVPPLGPNASSGPFAIPVTIPSTASPGTYYLIAKSDAGNQLSESSETNNTRYTTVGIGVDLIVLTLSAPAPTVSPGQVVNLTETTRNQGTAPSQGGTVTRFYWSTNSVWDASDPPIGERVITGSIAAGANSGPLTTPVTVPTTAVVGTYYFIARADAGSNEPETSEVNNTRATSVRIGPDLAVSTLTVPVTMVTPGQQINVSDTTKNQGTFGSGNTITRFYWSTNMTYETGDTPLGQRPVGPLVAGASTAPVETPITIPSAGGGGTYYIIGVADADNASSETSETNNTRFVAVGVGADLIVSTLTVPSAPVSPGQVVKVSDTTRNQGTAATGSTVTRFYWSANATYEASDTAIGERNVGPLAGGAVSGPFDTMVTVPSTATAGTYYIIARADATNASAETSEINNTRFSTIGIGVDLIVSSLSGSALPVSPGQVLTLSETTKNQGTAATGGGTMTRFYWSTNSIWDAADLPLAERPVGPLAAGASTNSVNTDVTIPLSATPGSYYIIARADADSSLTETSEINNFRSTSIGIGVDLVVSTLSGPIAPVSPGQTISVTDTTRNQGTVGVANNTVTRFYWSTNSTYEASDPAIGERPVDPLAPGTSSNPVTTNVTVPSTATSGTYYIIARADSDGLVTETSETNNTRSTTVGIGVDLIVSTFLAPSPTVAPGQTINLTETTRNQGTAGTVGSTITRYYWSTNSTVEASDLVLDERTVGALAAGDNSGPVVTAVTIPTTATSGAYYIIAKADADNAVVETSKINNTRSTRVTVP